MGPGVCGAVCAFGGSVAAPVRVESSDPHEMPCHAPAEPAEGAPAEPERTLPDCCEPDFEQASLPSDPPSAPARTSVALAVILPCADRAGSLRPPFHAAPPLRRSEAPHQQANPPLLI